MGVTCLFACITQRNSHWRVQNFVGHPPQTIKNGPGSAFVGKFDEGNISISPTMLTSTQNPIETDSSRDATCKALDRQPEVANKGIPLSMPTSASMSTPVRSDLQIPVSDSQSIQCPTTSDGQNQEGLMVEGGTISVTSAYSQGWVFLQTQEFFGC